MILAIFVVFSLLVIAIPILTRRRLPEADLSDNAELNKYYDMEGEQPVQLMRQLVKAARMSMDNSDYLVQKMESLSRLHDERLVSDDYFNSFIAKKDNLVIERIMIENEAEMLRPGSKDAIFAEAAKLPRQEHKASSQKKRYFDEAIYLKRRDILKGKLVTSK
ncbi:hypothetical protein PAEPH01_0618 [Pancytospora epiphaga]|nr:hypothetical protein PAEPH01_0618 [Pancytospora epiphaga]